MTRTQRLLKIQAEVEAAARKLHTERCREWRQNNPEKSRAATRKWERRNPIDAKLSKALWRYFNREKHLASCRAFREKNPNYQREWRARKKAEKEAARRMPELPASTGTLTP